MGGRSSAVKGKRAQKKNLKHEKKVVLHGKNAAASEEVENRSEVSNVEPTVSSEVELEDGKALPIDFMISVISCYFFVILGGQDAP